MTMDLVDLVGLSGLYEYERGRIVRDIAKAADTIATNGYFSRGTLAVMEDVGIPRGARAQFEGLATRMNTIYENTMPERSCNAPVIQVSSFLEALDDVHIRYFSRRGLSGVAQEAQRWINITHSLDDPTLVMYTVASWLVYINTRVSSVKKKAFDPSTGKLLHQILDSRPRRNYDTADDALGALKIIARYIGQKDFPDVIKNFFEKR